MEGKYLMSILTIETLKQALRKFPKSANYQTIEYTSANYQTTKSIEYNQGTYFLFALRLKEQNSPFCNITNFS
jgi:hypothetical protein